MDLGISVHPACPSISLPHHHPLRSLYTQMSLIEQFYSLPNISLGAVPIAGVLAALPHWFAVALAQRKKTNPPFDVSNPRVWVQGLNYRAVLERTGQQAGKKLAAHEWLVIQAEAAQANAFEHLPLFAVALVRSPPFSSSWPFMVPSDEATMSEVRY